ncbi:MAG: HDOD domain-containing protein [Candidatus Eisenbacteria bacterium]|nr:HDOD domain-containing protein [Candidatus Eisenbacteria bacterium]
MAQPGQVLTGEEVFRQLEGVDNLPTLPTVIEELGRTIRDPNSDAKRVSRIIEDDPAIMARILKVVNSAYYGGQEPITSVQTAVARMGMRAVNNIALSTAVFSAFGEQEEDGFDREEFWRHSISAGIASVVVYERAQQHMQSRYGKDVLHLAGLLHDIGKIIFDQFFHNEFHEALRVSRDRKIPLNEAEREVLGSDHAEVGAWLGMKWNLSSDILQVIRWHHEPEKTDVENWGLAAVCHTADYICNLEKIGDGGNAAPGFQKSVWKKLGLAVSDIQDVVEMVGEESKNSEILMAFV